MHSKITDKFQTTIPKAVREKLKLSRNDYIEWKLDDDRVIVEPAHVRFLDYRGSITTGRGDIRSDIRKARERIAKLKQ